MHGLIVIDKEKGMTSHDVVSLLRKKTGIRKIGHTGTLDPMATGVLILCIGRATRVASYVQGHDKVYHLSMEFGEETDTLDAEGNVTKKSDIIPKEKAIRESLQRFVGEQDQIPPMYSAIKVKGKKLYEHARKGEVLDVSPRRVTLYDIQFLSYSPPTLTLRIHCSSGTYVRSFARDLAHELGTVGHLTSLRRERVGKIEIQDAVTLEELRTMDKEEIEALLLPMEVALKDLPMIEVNQEEARRLGHGQRLRVESPLCPELCIQSEGILLGIGEVALRGKSHVLHMTKGLSHEGN